MNEDYVSFETAKLLREKGFDGDIDLWYDEDGEMFFQHKYDIIYDWRVRANQEVYECPTLQMAMKWLRVVHHIFIQVELYSKYDNYSFELFQNTHRLIQEKIIVENSPEEAAEAAIKYCLENLI